MTKLRKNKGENTIISGFKLLENYYVFFQVIIKIMTSIVLLITIYGLLPILPIIFFP